MIIRQARETDLPVILRLYQDLAGLYAGVHAVDAEECRSAWQRICADTRQYLLVAEVDDVVIGTLNLTIIPNLGHGGQPWAAIDNVIVSAECRGQGIGVTMLEEAGNIARQQRCYKIILSSNLVREKAHEFYRKLGWKETHIGFSLDL